LKEFKELNLKHELLEALNGMSFHNMTEVQELSIPIGLEHKDLIVRSKTGSGKTAAFLIPIFQSIDAKGYPQALIIVPTRELALQVSTVAEKLGRKGRIRTTVVYGGASINVQMQNLRRGADIIIGTPGRIIDLVERGALKLNRALFLVLDEADLMLDMGFIEDVELIISMVPKERQTILLSATMPSEITEIAKKYMKRDATKLTVGEEEDLTVSTINHNYFIASGRGKFSALLAYINKFEPKKCIIFTSTQRESEYVYDFINSNGFSAIVMHGGLTQARRERSLRAFKEHAQFLISTNLASRGLDIPDITDIINFDAPEDPKIYVHRVGRSARMGKNGRAFTIFGYDQEDLMKATVRLANIKINYIDLNIEKFKDIRLPQQQHRRFGRGSGGFNRGRNRNENRPHSMSFQGSRNRNRHDYRARQ
jgi:ATP-dependent RNA helicase DeaD